MTPRWLSEGKGEHERQRHCTLDSLFFFNLFSFQLVSIFFPFKCFVFDCVREREMREDKIVKSFVMIWMCFSKQNEMYISGRRVFH